MLISQVLFYLGVFGLLEQGVTWGIHAGLYLMVAPILAMGRRVIPFFIEKGVGYPFQPKNRRWLDVSSLALFLVFSVLDVFTDSPAITALLAGALVILHALRLAGWYTRGIWAKPLLWSLLLAYAFLVAGFALKVAAFSLGVSTTLAVHAFAVGGIGLVTVGMMSRVALGHTGRNVLDPPPVLFWIFSVLLLSALVRVVLPLVDGSLYSLWVGLSQALWIIVFSMFLVVYTPMLTSPRIDGRPG